MGPIGERPVHFLGLQSVARGAAQTPTITRPRDGPVSEARSEGKRFKVLIAMTLLLVAVAARRQRSAAGVRAHISHAAVRGGADGRPGHHVTRTAPVPL